MRYIDDLVKVSNNEILFAGELLKIKKQNNKMAQKVYINTIGLHMSHKL